WLHDQPIELRAAIAGHIARRAAHIIFAQLRIRVVDRTTRGALRDRIVLAYQLWHPIGGLDGFEIAVDPDFLELVDQDCRRVAIQRDVARRDGDLEVLVRAIAELAHHVARLLPTLPNVRTI